jgi:dUTP pyrophosphatase
MKIKVLKLTDNHKIKIPTYQTKGASGFDLCAAIDRPIELGPGNRYGIPTGLAFEIPEGYELQIRPRSGLAFNWGVMTSFGTVDSDYRGEVKLNMINHGRVNCTISPGDRIAQGVICPVQRVEIEEVTALSPTDRGNKGFGSTGV